MTDDDLCALYEAQARPLWAYVLRMTRDPGAADDIVQEAFLRVYEARVLTDSNADHRRRYLYTVATNLVRHRCRRQREGVQTEDLELTASDADPIQGLAVRQALDALPIVERQALWLSYAERYSSREIAQMLGYREGSLRQVLVRARRRFIERFGRALNPEDHGVDGR